MSTMNIIVWILFIGILAFFVIGFNKQMLEKHKKRLKDRENTIKNKENQENDKNEEK
jgi:hypothetical protein